MIRDQELREAHDALSTALKCYPLSRPEAITMHILGSTLLTILRVCDRLAARVENLEKDPDAF